MIDAKKYQTSKRFSFHWCSSWWKDDSGLAKRPFDWCGCCLHGKHSLNHWFQWTHLGVSPIQRKIWSDWIIYKRIDFIHRVHRRTERSRRLFIILEKLAPLKRILNRLGWITVRGGCWWHSWHRILSISWWVTVVHLTFVYDQLYQWLFQLNIHCRL